jgi:hypothetical protein
LTRKSGLFGSSSRATSIVTMRRGSPTWIAASPMPGASYMVASISSMKRRAASSTVSTMTLFWRSTASGIVRMSSFVIARAR